MGLSDPLWSLSPIRERIGNKRRREIRPEKAFKAVGETAYG